MKLLNVSYLYLPVDDLSTEMVSTLLDQADRETISMAPWPDYNYKPEVAFSTGYTDKALLIKFYVRERHLQAVYNKINDPVHKDSCVEFFIAFNNDDNYYNLEFNSVGACLAAYGDNRDGRITLPVSVIRQISHQTFVRTNNSEGLIDWELTLIIPKEVFCYHSFNTFSEQHCRANFYKCGDDLPEPHFLAWNAVKADQPNFHLPEYFGKMQFIWS